MIKSISFDQQEIIQNIIKLHCKYPIEVDATYSKGVFYKGDIIQQPKFKFDIKPQIKGVIKANAEKMPLKNDSVNTLMFDPPFLATTGKSLLIDDNSNGINKRFGVYPS